MAEQMFFDKQKSDEVAQSLLGLKFRVGGRGDDGTTDCYGILCFYYEKFGIRMPDYSSEENWKDRGDVYLREYASIARKLEKDEKPAMGDFILFKNSEGATDHAGVYLGDKRFIHSCGKFGVKIDQLSSGWGKRVYAYFRLKETDFKRG